MVRGVFRAWLRFAPLLLLCALAACGGGRLSPGGAPNYAAPGPAGDPWGPYVREAASRFDVPERWIREVMRQESGGHEFLGGRPTTSDAGAMGLMQIMPATYEELRARYGLGGNPYDPHDNILAGAGYIRELYDKYGAPGFLAAYDAGPQRLEDYNAGRSNLPNETLAYLASVGPRLGSERPMSGPLAVYAQGYGGGAPARPRDCLDEAYDPSHPCAPEAAPIQLAAAPEAEPVASPRPSAGAGCWHDPNLAYDPAAPCQPAPPVEVAEAPARGTGAGSVLWGGGAPAYAPTPYAPPAYAPPAYAPPAHAPPAAPRRPAPLRFALIPSANASELRPRPSDTRWGVQVGAFNTPDLARSVAENSRHLAPELAAAQPVVGQTAPFGGRVLYRARLTGLTAAEAAAACHSLAARAAACLTVPPGG